MTTSERISVARDAARAGAHVAVDSFRTKLAIEQKDAKTDVVTQADRDAQTAVIKSIRETFPEDAIVGEEEDALKVVPEDDTVWVIDPIDGTNNYVRGTRTWATVVGVVRDGVVTAGVITLPALNDNYWTDGESAYRNGTPVSVSETTDPEAGVVTPTMWWDFDSRNQYGNACQAIVDRFGDLRRIGSAQAALASVADGSLDAVITNLRTKPWDTLAGVAMVRAAGGTVTDLHGDTFRHDSIGLIASNGLIHSNALSAAQSIDHPDADQR
ncbi:inositol monophosphatase family protein [Haloquadratum walsbyi]|jgi:myo-inositol-1(or 4)-monophosphatase|uniref:inositol monophosphatase family protein n=1 Tax=Haloquadratum walsbyi TaxID=293091 RepID=UPI0015F69BAA|nr:inositol monophosphatase [Haloquadratum walsbyi]